MELAMKEQTEYSDQELVDFVRNLRETRKDVTTEKLRRQFDLSLKGAEEMISRIQTLRLIGEKTRAGYALLAPVDVEHVETASPDSQAMTESNAKEFELDVNREVQASGSGGCQESADVGEGAGESPTAVVAPPLPSALPTDVRAIPLSQVVCDETVQPRAGVDAGVMGNYAELMGNGVEFPPITVFEIAVGEFVLADGFHRVAAAKQAGLETMKATVVKGTIRDALLFAIRANASHGQGLTRKEKLRAAARLLNDPQWSQWSNSEIARICGLSGMHVGRLRKEADSNNVRVTKRKSRGKNGKVRVMETSRMGRKKCHPLNLAAKPDLHVDDSETSDGPVSHRATNNPPADPVSLAVDRLYEAAESFVAVATTESALHSVGQDRLVNLRRALGGIVAILPGDPLRSAA
jgi:hypothetical protein